MTAARRSGVFDGPRDIPYSSRGLGNLVPMASISIKQTARCVKFLSPHVNSVGRCGAAEESAKVIKDEIYDTLNAVTVNIRSYNQKRKKRFEVEKKKKIKIAREIKLTRKTKLKIVKFVLSIFFNVQKFSPVY